MTSSGPLVGKYLSIWGVKAIFPAGFLIDGGTFILFGLLQWVNDTTAFLIFSYLIRFLEVRQGLVVFNLTNSWQLVLYSNFKTCSKYKIYVAL